MINWLRSLVIGSAPQASAWERVEDLLDHSDDVIAYCEAQGEHELAVAVSRGQRYMAQQVVPHIKRLGEARK